jgi:glycosyltransferase A (GT-A) superfamily protein (DUF2064 family)
MIVSSLAKEESMDQAYDVYSSIAIIAKCPSPGKSKTRLIPLLGEEGSVDLAKSMFADILMTLSSCVSVLLLLLLLLFETHEIKHLFASRLRTTHTK